MNDAVQPESLELHHRLVTLDTHIDIPCSFGPAFEGERVRGGDLYGQMGGGKTQCTERDLMCEFTLQVVTGKAKKTGHARRFLFLHPKDPMFALVAQYREQGRVKQTNFFGIGSPVCAPRLK